jgi:hypothetical protein
MSQELYSLITERLRDTSGYKQASREARGGMDGPVDGRQRLQVRHRTPDVPAFRLEEPGIDRDEN